MLLTITYTGNNTQDLGYLLHKNPSRPQQFEISYGKAYVFYPEVSDERTTVALLLDIDPLDLAKGKVGSGEGGLFDYVNDRPYVCSSFMSAAISRIFGAAMNGKCKEKPELAEMPLELSATIYSLKDNGNEYLAEQMFTSLGYNVAIKRTLLDPKFPEWGMSPYIDLTISGKVKLSEMLNHIYVLIPVFDTEKHYFVSDSEVNKLLGHGGDWLPAHPYKDKITRRYLGKRSAYIKKANEALSAEELVMEDGGSDVTEAELAEEKEKKIPLNTIRLETVKKTVLDSGAESVIDFGCGEGRLEQIILREPQIKKITAVDVSVDVLEIASRKLRYEKLEPELKDKLTLTQGSVTYKDERFKGYDCACLVEVIEHIDKPKLPDAEKAVFGVYHPKTVVVTTPNKDYNTVYGIPDEELRHKDHRFEWTREEFKKWTEEICKTYKYVCQIENIGDCSEEFGSATMMGVFKRL